MVGFKDDYQGTYYKKIGTHGHQMIEVVTQTSAAIQAAINALPATGGIIFIPEGSYSIISSLTLPNSNITIQGAGNGTILTNASGITMWNISSVNNITFKDLNMVGFSSGTDKAIVATTCVDLSILNCTFGVFESDVITILTNSHRLYIDGCIFSGDNGVQIRANSGSGHNHIIVNNRINSGSTGIAFYGDGESSIVSNNYVANTADVGIEIDAGGEYSVISNNVLYNITTGIYIEGSDINIGNNIIQGDGTADGMEINGNRCIVDSNRVHYCEDGIYITGNYNTVSNNICTTCTWSGIETTTDYLVVVGNMCNGNTRHGIHLNTSNNCNINDNTCIDNDSGGSGNYDGIFLAASDRNLISNNRCITTVASKQRYGINISNATCDNNRIDGNMLVSNETGAINDSGTNTEIDHNQTS